MKEPQALMRFKYLGSEDTMITDRQRYVFKATTYHDGTPWIAMEPLQQELTMLLGFFGFDLTPGTSHERAKAIAEFLNDNIAAVVHTHDLEEGSILS